MSKWTITVNGVLHGTYPDSDYANMAYAAICQSRPKNKYNVSLMDTRGAVVASMETPVRASKRQGKSE